MGAIRIIKGGLFTTVQDLGRYGYQSLGVTQSGSMDSYNHKLANILVDNDIGDALLEFTFIGPEIEILEDMAIAVTGGDVKIEINSSQRPMYETLYVVKGDIVRFSPVENGSRCYIAFSGGIDVDMVMNSRATHTKTSVGGYMGRKLADGDILNILKTGEIPPKRIIPLSLRKNYSGDKTVRVILGPQDDMFTEKAIETFLNSTYKVSDEMDRMGIRLEGEEIEHISKADIISDPIFMGAIQIPGHKNPIVMMADRQTTGGYPKIGTVITVDLPLMAQLRPKDRVRFTAITVSQAQKLLREEHILIEKLKEESLVKVKNKKTYSINVNNKNYIVDVEEIEYSL